MGRRQRKKTKDRVLKYACSEARPGIMLSHELYFRGDLRLASITAGMRLGIPFANFRWTMLRREALWLELTGMLVFFFGRNL